MTSPVDGTEGIDGASAPDDPARLEVRVRGRVQGVGFRYFAWREARERSIVGWVANDDDGTVRCVAEGRRTGLEGLLARLEVGPSSAVVEGVDVRWSPALGGLTDFSVRSGGHRGD